jgi:hypothetical protein
MDNKAWQPGPVKPAWQEKQAQLEANAKHWATQLAKARKTLQRAEGDYVEAMATGNRRTIEQATFARSQAANAYCEAEKQEATARMAAGQEAKPFRLGLDSIRPPRKR